MQGKITAALLSLYNKNSIALDAAKKVWSEAKEAEKYVQPRSEHVENLVFTNYCLVDMLKFCSLNNTK